MVLASKGEESDLDKYEDDVDDDMDDGMSDAQKKKKKMSHIYFRPFNEYKNLKDWHYEIEDGENVECLAMGTGWVAAYTDFGYIRVFSSDGIQKYIMC